VKLFCVIRGQAVLGELLNERQDLLTRLSGYISSIPAHSTQHLVDRVLPVQKLPQVDAGRAEAKTMACIGIEEHGPVVKLLPE
jgi:hypothetical protein